MAYHVPFSQRPSGMSQPQPPVYIGFNEPRVYPRPKFNWWGFNGLFLCLVSFGILSPIALLISLVGLRRRPRKMAVAGTFFSLIGVGIMATIAIAAISEHNQHQYRRHMAHQKRVVTKQIKETEKVLMRATIDFENYCDSKGGELPDVMDGNMMAIEHQDAWKEMLRYEIDKDFAILRSAGPDGQFDTSDDLTSKIDGQTDRDPLLPVD